MQNEMKKIRSVIKRHFVISKQNGLKNCNNKNHIIIRIHNNNLTFIYNLVYCTLNSNKNKEFYNSQIACNFFELTSWIGPSNDFWEKDRSILEKYSWNWHYT